ncbi:hypothetical protein SprV_0401565800 [Sparganum proliferum]
MIVATGQMQEKCQEMRTHLYSIFVDLRKALEMVNREGVWKIMQKFGCYERFTQMVRQLRNVMMARVIDNEAVSEAFTSPVSTITVHELLFADDCALNSTTVGDMQRSMDLFSVACENFVLIINTQKTVNMHQPPPNEPPPPQCGTNQRERNPPASDDQLHVSGQHPLPQHNNRRRSGPPDFQEDQIRRYKDTLETSQKRLHTNPDNWADLARDRLTWRRIVKTGAAVFKVNRFTPTKVKRETRQSQQPPPHNANSQPPPTCQRTFRAPTGLIGHLRTKCSTRTSPSVVSSSNSTSLSTPSTSSDRPPEPSLASSSSSSSSSNSTASTSAVMASVTHINMTHIPDGGDGGRDWEVV